jgi:hypothetical protein
MARFVTWLGNLGTIKASSLKPHISAVNNFYKDHGREHVALGDLVARVRKGLGASHVNISPTRIRVLLPAKVVYFSRWYEQRLSASTYYSYVLRTYHDARSSYYEQESLPLYYFLSSLAVVQGLSALLVTSSPPSKVESSYTIVPTGDRKGQRGITTKHRILCAISGNTHGRVAASRMDFFGSLCLASDDKTPLYRWAIDKLDKQAN